jgi:hypothetical protein
MTYEAEFGIERGGDVIVLTIRGNVSRYIPAKTWGPPENCYPAEGGEAEIEEILLNGKPWDGELTDKEREGAEEALQEKAANDDDYDGPNPDDDYDDRD